ncbi:MAG: DUF4192 domain-containing protein, partial [Mycolicibacterium sp.]|uniref:DUF4192 domain-containing protein n=1 Tax=Mycolicibacterium sp. TaxID=2320850 RepID=UPI003D105E4E
MSLSDATNNTFKLNRPSAAIAALPALLGFTPELSLALLLITDGKLTATARVDLTDARSLIDTLAYSAAAGGADTVIAVVVDAEGAQCDVCGAERRELIVALRDALSERGIELVGAHVVDRVEAGGHWRCYDDCGAGGLIEDPAESLVMLAAVLEGRVVHKNRQALEELITISDPARTAHLADLLAEAERRNDLTSETKIAAELTAALATLRTLSATQTLADSDAVRLAVALADHRIRDCLIGLSAGSQAHEAVELWTRLSQLLPESHRVEPLALLALSSYAIGESPKAGIALTEALRINPSHRLAGLLDVALTTAMPPEQVRELAVQGYRMAQRYGVHLP